MGARSHRGLANLLRSAQRRFFATRRPVLLVPPADLDIVASPIEHRSPAVRCYAVDLTEECGHRARLAAEFASTPASGCC
jgi:hypothetical protein